MSQDRGMLTGTVCTVGNAGATFHNGKERFVVCVEGENAESILANLRYSIGLRVVLEGQIVYDGEEPVGFVADTLSRYVEHKPVEIVRYPTW